MRRIAVVGMGYVGCVTAACLSRDGNQVMGVDIDNDKVDAINSGVSSVTEPGLDRLVREQVEAGRLSATRDLERAVLWSELALIAVGTPSATDGGVLSGGVERVVEGIGSALRSCKPNYSVIVRSTLLPGILEDVLLPLLESSSGFAVGDSVHLCNHPEFLRETTAIRDYDDPPFILVGAEDQELANKVFDLYPNVKSQRLVTDTRTAALVKYACNAFHALKIGFANEIGALAMEFGADGREVMKILCRDNRLNISPAYLRPGFAFGGSCLPKDVRALCRFAQRIAIQTDILSAILPSNESHLQRGLSLIQSSGLRKVGLVGLSFKAGTDDVRESPMVLLAEILLGRGYDLRIYDPCVRPAHLVGSNQSFVDRHLPHLAGLLVDRPADILSHCDLLVLGTDIANDLAWRELSSGEVIDLRIDLVKCPSKSVPA